MREIILSEEVQVKVGVGQYILPNWQEELCLSQNYHKRKTLEHFFTNVDGRVTAIRGTMPSVLAAALTARFSRAQEFDIAELSIEGSDIAIFRCAIRSAMSNDVIVLQMKIFC